MSEHHDRRRDSARRGRRRNGAATLEEQYFGIAGASPDASADDAAASHRDPKALRLCRQVREQLDLAIAELDDPTLDGVAVLEVGYVGGGQTIRVDVIAPSGADPFAIASRLDAVKGRLRSEIAAAIHRKRTPMLCFAVLPADWWAHAHADTAQEEDPQ